MTEVRTQGLTGVERQLLEEVSADRLWSHAETLAQWEKISGTPGERSAVGYLRSQLEEFGLDVEEHEFESLLGWPEEAEVQLRSPEAGRLDAITHSFVPSSPPGGLEAEVVPVGEGEFASRDVRGRIAIIDGIASPGRVLNAGRAGAAGVIFVNHDQDRIHEMCVSPVWGTPTTETAPLLPKIPVVSMREADGERLKTLAAQGPTTVHLRTKTFWDWRPVPVLTGEIQAPSGSRDFVLFSGHHCSWYVGAMDNGTANATMLEVARILSQHRDRLRRNVRIAFWPGHTQGRYSGSTWYFDTFWEDLHDHCVLHVNADSTGARGATLYRALGMPGTREFALAAVRDATGVEAEPERQSRAGDQSFWSCGVPSIFMDLSEVPAELSARTGSSGLFTAAGQPPPKQEGGLPWWWHTAEDTIDKIDREVLQRDTRVFLLATLRAATSPLVRLQFEPSAREIREAIERYQGAAGDRIDLGPAARRAAGGESAARELDGLLEEVRGRDVEQERAERVNRVLLGVDRPLVMMSFTSAFPFDQDLALPVPPVPLLAPAERLAKLDPSSSETRFLTTELVRRRNKVTYQLRLAGEAAEEAIALLRS